MYNFNCSLSFSQPGVIVLIYADLLPPYDVSNIILINCKEKDIRIFFLLYSLYKQIHNPVTSCKYSMQ